MQSKELLSDKIANILAQGIKSGFYPLGAKMPGEMELCQELGVSRATLREAIKRLESMNLLEIKRGIGTFVAEKPGVFEDPMGIAFVKLEAEKHRIYRWVKMAQMELLEAVRQVNKPHDAVSQALKESMSKNALSQLMAYCGYFEWLANAEGKPFAERHLMFLHQTLIQVYKDASNPASEETKRLFKLLVLAIESEDASAIQLNSEVLLDAIVIDLNEEN